ncbi:MAG: hypothetical protein AAFQ09_00135 [Pseudomonadota bacterium]
MTRGFVRDGSDTIQGDFDFWISDNTTRVDLLSDQGVVATDTGAYRVQVVQAGSYRLTFVEVGSRSLVASDPAGSGFTVRPGEVVYLGDIDLRSVGSKPAATVTDRNAQARAAVTLQAPQFAPLMQTRLVTCSVCVPR